MNKKLSIIILICFLLAFTFFNQIKDCLNNPIDNKEPQITNVLTKKGTEISSINSIAAKNSDVFIRYYQPNITQFITWPDIYHNKVVYANYNIKTNETRQIHLLDLQTLKEEIIYSLNKKDGSVIDDTRIGSEWVFWIEGDIPKWRIKAYNIKNKTIKILKESTSNSTLTPRIDNDNNTVVWLEGESDEEGNINHFIYTYNMANDKFVKLATVSEIINPYDITRIRNNVVSLADKINGKWVIRIIDTIENQEEIIYCETRPERPCCDGKKLIWQEENEYDKELYLLDLQTSKKTLVDNNIFLFDLHKEDVIYTKSEEKHHLNRYYSNEGIRKCLTASVNKENIYFEFFNCYEDTIVCIYDDLPRPNMLTIFEQK